MGRRIDVDESLPPVAIPVRILNELCTHAWETLPEECCGLIVGDERERFDRVVRCRNEMTQKHHEDPRSFPRDGRGAFWMNETDYLHAREEAQAKAQRVTAIYHSHIGVGAYLSEEDLAYAEHAFSPFPDADHLVLAVVEGERKLDGVGIFQREGVGRPFLGHPLKPEVP